MFLRRWTAPCDTSSSTLRNSSPRKTPQRNIWIRPIMHGLLLLRLLCQTLQVAAVAEWYRYWTVAGLVMSSSPMPLKTCRVGQRCTLNLSRAEMSSRWCGVVVRRGGASSGVVHVT
ncbi:uncharacterized protein TNCV_3925661 [Trichonephila clavipes]|nr:uncharacterized protein TNCV_3925661 [Trichonephila clavipes]